ncbi:MAG: hypothetical protein PHF17_03955 [Arcobacteraceae bacterium]|nr:hypothetical protein [Arcobacteraceae bacterium]
MKMNNCQTNQQAKEFEHNLSYEEWLRDNLQPLTTTELNQTEQENKVFIIKKPSIFPYPINTLHYQPLKGA